MDTEVVETTETMDETPIETTEEITDIEPYEGESNSVMPGVLGFAGGVLIAVAAPKIYKGVKKGAHFVKGKIDEGLTKLKTKKSEDSEESNDHVVIDDVEDEKTK